MTVPSLASPKIAEDALARLFLAGQPATLEVSEETAFCGGRLNLGQVMVQAPETTNVGLRTSVRVGSFIWIVPPRDEVEAGLKSLASKAGQSFSGAAAPRSEAKLASALDAIVQVAARIGLVKPVFDARIVQRFPLHRPATVVADTSGVHHGALNFVASYLQPMARIKLPAILHMEIVNQADRYFSARRKRGKPLDQLCEHLKSQTGQRALLRLELKDDTEIERNFLLSDPLRSAFIPDKDEDLKDLNLSVPLKSYVDRLILEAARQHQYHAPPGHDVFVLTGDQGLARMAIAEGVPPMFFRHVRPEQFFDRRLSGALLHPIKGTLVGHSLAEVLWELATAFGQARLSVGEAFVEATALHADLPWSSYHTQDDLLWFSTGGLPQWPVESRDVEAATIAGLAIASPTETASQDGESPLSAATIAAPTKPKSKATRGRSATQTSTSERGGVRFHRFSPQTLVTLVDALSESGPTSDADIARRFKLSNKDTRAEHRRLLVSGGFIRFDAGSWIPTDALQDLALAQRLGDVVQMATHFMKIPSYQVVADALTDAWNSKQALALELPQRVRANYTVLAEITGIGATVEGIGLLPTPEHPSVARFTDIAMQTFHNLAAGERLVSAGAWLEALVQQCGVHPLVARDKLREAAAARLLRPHTEGSTIDTSFDDHTLRVLQLKDGRPVVENVFLYRGDFLTPGKASTSLSLERVEP
ncbi:hypothetical protein [Neoroseomonas oryzicola]|uniref:PIN domain-containing protein n=1 Tax=Neoroseomonas oryzicola TaxID=535904 RepID=A0A9X9WLH8_9PROT|nr:hypothetical protein [Neoroseomonas oryzicola]MBR0661188.1 hypothetical protein [Neoroseomonas oryzicola]NKE17553.1 hypothetical protein [Neoroseomonas oryzicola]